MQNYGLYHGLRARIEKLPFLLDNEGDIKLSYHYVPMALGPYSIELIGEINLLQNRGYISVIEEVVPISDEKGKSKEVERRSYCLTIKGREEAKKLSRELPPEIKTAINKVKKYNDMPLTDLLNYVHNNYPNYQKKNQKC